MALSALRFMTIPLAVLLDHFFGEPPILHPLAGFGRLANLSENFFHPGYAPNERKVIANLFGASALLVVVAPPVMLSIKLTKLPLIGSLLDLTLLYLTIAPRSLKQHAEEIHDALRSDNLHLARSLVAKIVSRDTTNLNERNLAAATVESILENANDAIFGALFWYLIAGSPGAIFYRLVNTLDAMWGYKNERYQDFGWSAARLDDLLNLAPARLTALTFALVGDTSTSLNCWNKQGSSWYSPNAGPVMAAGAGALAVILGGDAKYGGVVKSRPLLGCGKTVDAKDITRALTLVRKALKLWSVLSVISGILMIGRKAK